MKNETDYQPCIQCECLDKEIHRLNLLLIGLQKDNKEILQEKEVLKIKLAKSTARNLKLHEQLEVFRFERSHAGLSLKDKEANFITWKLARTR